MFFQGSLQEGIGKAIQEKKRVVCFVRSDDDESKTWEEDYLQPMNEILQDYAVVLQLQQGSTEAGYLSAICPVDQAPTIAVVYNGQVKGTLKPPQTLEQFRQGLLTAMDLDFRMSGGSSATQAQAQSQPQNQTATVQPAPAPAPVAAPRPSTASSPALSDTMTDRRSRMAEFEAAEERRKQEAQEARRQAVQDPNSNEAYQAKLAEEKKKQRQKAAEERQRVLDLIEADKRQRREQAAQRAAERNAQKQQAEADAEDVVEKKPVEATRARAAGAGGKCRLQLRLWDGRTERAEFMALQTLSYVKEWLDKNIEPKSGPYSLREVIGTGAARQLDVADEQETLSSLGLTPSATLIVKPISNVSSKMDGAKRSVSKRLGPFVWLFQLIFGFLLAIWTTLAGFVKADHRDRGPADQQAVPDNESTARMSGAQPPAGRIQTLDDRKKKDKPTLYNGNQLGVLPNTNDENNDEDEE